MSNGVKVMKIALPVGHTIATVKIKKCKRRVREIMPSVCHYFLKEVKADCSQLRLP